MTNNTTQSRYPDEKAVYMQGENSYKTLSAIHGVPVAELFAVSKSEAWLAERHILQGKPVKTRSEAPSDATEQVEPESLSILEDARQMHKLIHKVLFSGKAISSVDMKNYFMVLNELHRLLGATSQDDMIKWMNDNG